MSRIARRTNAERRQPKDAGRRAIRKMGAILPHATLSMPSFGQQASVPRRIVCALSFHAISCMAILGVCSLLMSIVRSDAEAVESRAAQPLGFGGRPAGMYRLVVNKDRTVCTTILTSLNKPYVVPEEHASVLTNPSISSEVLLSADIQIEWKRKFIVSGWDNSKIDSIVDFAISDIENNGNPQAIYRWGYYHSNRGANELFTHKLPDHMFSDSAILSLDFITELRNENGSIEIDPKSAPELFDRRGAPVGDVLVTNIVSIRNMQFLLVAGGIAVERAVVSGRPFTAYVLRYQTDGSLPLLCELEGATHLRRQNDDH